MEKKCKHKLNCDDCLWFDDCSESKNNEICEYYLSIEEEEDIEEIIEENRQKYYKYFEKLQKQMEDEFK